MRIGILGTGTLAKALGVVSELVRDVGGAPAVLGPLERVRQLEGVAGFVIGLASAGSDPNSAIPHVPSPATQSGSPSVSV
jgi:predicted dinucleotide-binding enzyme